MAAINTGGSGIDGEDQISSGNMSIYTDLGDWERISQENPGRTTKACRQRWLNSLSPDLTQSTWTPEEDRIILELYQQLGAKWTTIASHIAGRSGDACSERYREALEPNPTKNDWLPEEDAKLEEIYPLQDDTWSLVGQDLHRNGLTCGARWNLLERRRPSRTLQSDLLGVQFTKPEANSSIPSVSSQIPSAESAHTQDNTTFAEPDWPPYYPPEAYPTFPSDEDPQVLRSFREPTPEIIISVSPHVAPFQFSSSSLSAALSDPPKLPKPLPPLTGQAFSQLDLEPQPSLSPLPIQNSIPDINFGEPILDILLGTDHHPGDFPSSPYRHLLSGLDTAKIDQTAFNSISPISLPTDISVQSDNGEWQSPGLSEMFFSLFEPSSSQSSAGYDAQEEFSSASSTPFAFSSSLSPTSSPGMVSPLELPPNESSTSGSLLFSQSNSPNSGRARRLTPKRISKLLKQTPTRLSSMLPITSDGSVRPYACGRESCWPPGDSTSSHCFATSRELFEHSKEQHATGLPGDKPYKCALAGCGKSWKSLNGLQYHLQISTAHFKNAVTSRFSLAQKSNLNDDQAIAGTLTETEDEDRNRVWQCLKPNCFKAYRHSSGLRYHVKHGHPEHLPAQLSEVPPTLARQLPAKTMTMKRKHPSDFED